MKKDLTGYYCFVNGHNWTIIENYHKTLVIAKCKSCGKKEIIFINEEKSLYFSEILLKDKVLFI